MLCDSCEDRNKESYEPPCNHCVDYERYREKTPEMLSFLGIRYAGGG